eukprot:m.346750 g.346750  ORF g.346750 m.346750 type:complete len:330 (-) comp27916_c0_seq5:2123-3112(-)
MPTSMCYVGQGRDPGTAGRSEIEGNRRLNRVAESAAAVRRDIDALRARLSRLKQRLAPLEPSVSCPLRLDLDFDFVADARAGLPADRTGDPTARHVEDAVYCVFPPTPLAHPVVVLTDPAVLRALGCAHVDPALLAELTAGNVLPTGAAPAAFGYCGHQFGSFAGQLGDGAALSLGEVEVAVDGAGGPTRAELQLKGSGPTPYTRPGLSGRKALAPLVDEFVQMAALRRLGIPTVSAAALVLGDGGHAVMLRCGRSFLRFGTMELANQAAANGVRGPAAGNTGLLRAIADHVLTRFYPAVLEAGAEDAEAVYGELLLAITTATARLVAG